jgi:hypothetical protein
MPCIYLRSSPLGGDVCVRFGKPCLVVFSDCDGCPYYLEEAW